jgi:hypothetical protein
MRTAFILVSIACLLIGLSIGLIARGERLDDLPQRTVEIARGGNPGDASAARSTPKSPVTTEPITYGGGSVSIAGISIQRELAHGTEYGASLPFFGTQAVTRVALEMDLAKHPEGADLRIVSMVPESSTVSRFVDDLDTELTLEDSFGSLYEMNTNLSEDGLGLAVFVGSAVKTHPRASRLIVEGSLALLCASEKGTITSDSAPLAVGSNLSVEGYEFELTSSGASDWEEGKWNFELKTTDSLDSVISWSLVTEDGEVIELGESMTWSSGDTINKTLTAPKEFAAGALQLEIWSDGQVLQVPYSLSSGIGMR